MSKRRERPRYDVLVSRYLDSLSQKERVRHFTTRKYPSGQGRRGGANRSSGLRREIAKSTTNVTLCLLCGGVSQEIAALTSLFPLCNCGPFRLDS